MKQSQAFAAFRASLITDKNHSILNELVPVFNSRCEDIRRRVENDFQTYHNQAKTDNLKKTLVYDLVLARKQVLAQTQESFQKAVSERLQKDDASLEETSDGHIVAKFPDNSSARVPHSLWVDYQLFDRV